MRPIYWILGAVVVVLAVVALITYSAEKENAQAEQKAQELTQKFERAGLPVPQDQDIIVRSLGDDGGAICDTADEVDDGLGKAILLDQLYNGADFVGRRPIVADRGVLTGAVLILDTYCPEQLDKFRDTYDELKYDNVIES